MAEITQAESDALEADLALHAQQNSLSSQADSSDTVQGRAKDVLGLLTLAGSFIGAFSKSGDSSTTNVSLLLEELAAAPGGWSSSSSRCQS